MHGLHFSIYLCYVLLMVELGIVVMYTDYYTYFEEYGMAGRFGTGVIYTYVVVVA